MHGKNLLSPEDIADVRQAILDVGSATFGRHPVTFIDKSNPVAVYGESPTYADTTHELECLVIDPTTEEKVDNVRAQFDYDMQLMFVTDYLIEQSLPDLTIPSDHKREWEWDVDSLIYTTKRIKNDAQFGVDHLIIFIDLERL